MKTPGRKISSLSLPTLGGVQFWVDRFFYAGWRIQQNVLSRRHRLLSPANFRKARGSFRECKQKFENIKAREDLKPPDKHLILMVHGMAGWKETFYFLRKHLQKKGFYADGYNYPSLRGTLSDQAKDLNRFISSLEDLAKITLIGHSQGGLVIRQALARNPAWQNKILVAGVIFIGTPNQGAALADFSKRLKALGKAAPKVRDQLTPEFAKSLPIPEARIGLIAGSARKGKGINPAIRGDDDGIVGVEEVWIPGIRDRLVVPSDHFTLANRKKVRTGVVRFLEGKPLEG